MQITQGVALERPPPSGVLPSTMATMPSRLFTLSAGKSLSAMASLDLSWLGDGTAAAQQAAAAAAAFGAPDSTLPDAPPMPPYLTSHTVAPDPVRVPYPGTPTQATAPPTAQLPPSPAPAAAVGAEIDAVNAALMEAQAAYWRALQAQAAGQGLQALAGPPGAPAPGAGAPPQPDPAQQWALQHTFMASMAQQGQQGPFTPPPSALAPPLPAGLAAPGAGLFVPPSPPQSPTAAGPFPVYVPTDIGPPRTPFEARADAMAQWARERALMAAMTGSDMETAVRAISDTMGAGAGGAGGWGGGPAGVPPARGGAVTRGAGAPTVHLTHAQPIRVACTSPSSPRTRPSQ